LNLGCRRRVKSEFAKGNDDMGGVADGFDDIDHCSYLDCGAGRWEDSRIVVWSKRRGTRDEVRIGELFHVVRADVEDGNCVGEAAVQILSVV